MRRRALLLFPALSWVIACSMDWGSIEPLEGGVPMDGSPGDVKSGDAKGDASTMFADSSTDGAGSDGADDAAGDGASDDGTSSDALANDGGLEGSVDASDGGAGDASDGSTGSDASDGGTVCAYTTTGTLATWDLSGLTGITITAPATSTASGITAGALGRSGGLTAVSASGGINSTGWSTASTADTTLYYTFTVTPPSGCTMAITSLSLDTLSSTDGPGNGIYTTSGGDVATSADGFSAMTSFKPSTAGAVSLSVSGATAKVEVRVYGYNALKTTGSMRIRNTMSVSGSLK